MPEPGPNDAPPVAARHSHWWDPAWNRATWILLAVFMIPIALATYWLLSVAPHQSTIDASTQITASHLAEGGVQPFRGTKHTVYQATAPLPSAANPRSDGRLTLAWFSGTNCGQCKQMDPFVWDTLKSYADKFVVMEKELGRQPQSARFGVTDTPEFVLLSPNGTALARFGYQPDAAALKVAINNALKKTG